MATRADREAVEAIRRDYDARAGELGHALLWRLGENANRRGHAYFLDGECTQCGAGVTVGPSWTSCPTVRDARHDRCSGANTVLLTEIEAERVGELVAAAVARFGEEIREQQERR